MRLLRTQYNSRLWKAKVPGWILFVLFLLAHPAASPGAAQSRVTTAGAALTFLNVSPAVHYLGSETCSRCHSEIYQRYRATKMGRSIILATGPEFLKLVPQPVTIYNEKLDRHFQVFAKGNHIYQSEYQTDAGGKEIFRNTQPLAYAIGAGLDGYGFIVQQGDYLFEAPLSYYSHSRSWELSPGYQSVDFGFNRPIGRDCIVCHSGRPQPVKGREGRFENPPFLEMAVGCENCHGPGELHVKQRLAAAPLQGSIDQSIVNPAHLTRWRADNICMNCHQGGDARIEQAGRAQADFRPSQVLDDSIVTLALPFTPHSSHSSPLLQHYSLMIMSKCYRSSGGRLSCITCHSPHADPARAEIPAYFRRKCLSCHTETSCGIPLLERMKKTPANDCAKCHMPKQNLAMISHSSLTNHRILAREGEPFPKEALELTSNQAGLVHISAVPGKEKAPLPPLVLLEAYGQLVDSHTQYRASFKMLLDKLAKTEPESALVAEESARQALFEKTPQSLKQAAQHLRKAIALRSNSAEDYETLGQVLARAGQDTEAVDALKRALVIDPYRARPYQALTMLYVKTHQYAEALAVMKKELEVFPQDSMMRELIRRAESDSPLP